MEMDTQFLPDKLNLDLVLFTNTAQGFVASTDSNVVYHTSNGGTTWNILTTLANIRRIYQNQFGDIYIDAGTIYRTNYDASTWEPMMYSNHGSGCTLSGNIFIISYNSGRGDLQCEIYARKTGDLLLTQSTKAYLNNNIIIEKNHAIFHDANESTIEFYNADENRVTTHYLSESPLNGIFFDQQDTVAVSYENIEKLNFNDNIPLWSQYADYNQYDFKDIHGYQGLFATVGQGCLVTNQYTEDGDWTTLVNDNFEPFSHQLLGVQVIHSKLIYAVGENGVFLKCKI
jgi:hypothetical protein